MQQEISLSNRVS
jgi:hypothetical protein